MKKWNFSIWRVLNSPFRCPKLVWYFGAINKGVPYFLPRKWVDSKEKKGYKVAKSVQWLWVDILPLGWKTKWDYDDFRFEYHPMLSIVFMKRQLCIWIVPDTSDSVYWEAWLYYDRITTGTPEERFKQLIKRFPCTWIRYKKDKQIRIDYYPIILKKKYVELYNQLKSE